NRRGPAPTRSGLPRGAGSDPGRAALEIVTRTKAGAGNITGPAHDRTILAGLRGRAGAEGRAARFFKPRAARGSAADSQAGRSDRAGRAYFDADRAQSAD